jgi:hypothetical protein
MTPGEFQYLMGSTKCFSQNHNTFGYFASKNGRVCQVSTNWNYRGQHYSEKVEVLLYRNKGGRNPWMVKFSDASGRFHSYELQFLSMIDFIDELGKFVFTDEFKSWSIKTKRDYRLKEII